MKKSATKLREEIDKLEQQLRAAEAREAERIGRLALKAGLGDIEIEDGELVEAFKDVLARFRRRLGGQESSSMVAPIASPGTAREA